MDSNSTVEQLFHLLVLAHRQILLEELPSRVSRAIELLGDSFLRRHLVDRKTSLDGFFSSVNEDHDLMTFSDKFCDLEEGLMEGGK